MSTKTTISHGQNYHLYQEIFDVSHVYLRVEGREFDVSRDGAMIQIPIEAWRTMIEDWSKRGWPKEEDNSEQTISTEWINSFQKTLNSVKEK
jgi:hypothetical protein